MIGDMSRSTNMRRALLVFFRYPRPGTVKKRLATEIGPERACSIYEKLLRRTLGVVSDFKLKNPDTRILLFHLPEDPADEIARRFSGPWQFHQQVGDHLGTRMENAINFALSTGAGKAVLIGTDIADISVNELEEAFRKTVPGGAVLGPASDGGFYLIGLSRPCGRPFHFEQWGTPDACSRTRHALASAGLDVKTVRTRSDVDRPEDLVMLDRRSGPRRFPFRYHSDTGQLRGAPPPSRLPGRTTLAGR